MSHPIVKRRVDSEQEAQNILQRTMRGIGDAFGAVDDAYMGAGRSMLGLPDKGLVPEDGFAPGIRNAGGLLFGARPGATGVNNRYQYEGGDFGNKAAIIGNRALHAGGITAAGAGLLEIGAAITSGFGGAADGQTMSQLQMKSDERDGRLVIGPVTDA